MDEVTNMTPEWVQNAVRKNPCVKLDSGNVRTCPVRLSFPNVFTRGKAIPPAIEGKFGANLIFPVQADLTVLKAAMAEVVSAKWPDAGKKGGPKLRSPLKAQSEMADRWAGYGEEGFFLSCNSNSAIPVYDTRQQPITDPDRVYPGVWAICTIAPKTYDVGVNKGATFYLQMVMVIADDMRLGGGAASPSDFAGIDIDASVSGESVFDNEEDAAAKLFG